MSAPMPHSSPQHSSTSTSCVIQIGVLAANCSHQQPANSVSTPLPKPPQAATPDGSTSQLVLLKQLSSLRSAAAECRICLSAGSAEQELIQPCACAGTMGYTHAACLAAWVQEKGSLTCELCKQQYQEPYVQALGLIAAAEKTGRKDRTSPAADEYANSSRLRFWLLMFLSTFILAFVAMTVVIFCKNHTNTLERSSRGPDAMKCYPNSFGVQICS